MAILRIYDLKENVLALDLKDLLRLLTPRSLQANWTVSTVKSSEPWHEWFDATVTAAMNWRNWRRTARGFQAPI